MCYVFDLDGLELCVVVGEWNEGCELLELFEGVEEVVFCFEDD